MCISIVFLTLAITKTATASERTTIVLRSYRLKFLLDNAKIMLKLIFKVEFNFLISAALHNTVKLHGLVIFTMKKFKEILLLNSTIYTWQ